MFKKGREMRMKFKIKIKINLRKIFSLFNLLLMFTNRKNSLIMNKNNKRMSRFS